jgi:hypothetical protein
MSPTHAVALSIALTASSFGVVPQDQALPFSCATFPPNVSAADLRERFGEQHVETAQNPWGGAGTVMSRSDGRLQEQDANGCRLRQCRR